MKKYLNMDYVELKADDQTCDLCTEDFLNKFGDLTLNGKPVDKTYRGYTNMEIIKIIK